MFSLNSLGNDSFPICVIKKLPKEKVVETIYFTEPTRELKKAPKDFNKEIAKYLSPEAKPGEIILDSEKYCFEMVPTISKDGGTNPRFINFYLSASNSGKSFQITALCKRYLEMFPDNTIAYASANPIEGDKNYDEIREKIKVVDVLNLESTIDFSQEQYHNSLWIFDDCDSGFCISMEDLDSRLNEEEMAKLSVTDKNKAVKMLKAKVEMANEWVQKSIVSFMQNGRKYKQSLCIVGHKPYEGRQENRYINEASGIVLFPASMKKNILQKFCIEKLGMEKHEAAEIFTKWEWFKYDWLYVSHRTSVPFIITLERLKLLEN